MSGGEEVSARVVRRIHPGLTLDVSMAIGREVAVVFGPSGAGKTSLLRAIAGLDRPGSGRIAVGGATWFDSASGLSLPLRSRVVGVIFQDDLLFPHMSAAANIAFGLHALDRVERPRRVAEVAELCGVAHLLDRSPAKLSGGERQRIGLARALAPRPKLLLCDEPVSAIDLDGRFALLARLREIHAQERLPILYVTHSPAEAVAVGSVLLALEGGRIADRGPPLDVLARRAARIDDLRNVLRGEVAGHAPGLGATLVKLDGGPTLTVPRQAREVGARVAVLVRADDVLLARGAIEGLSARNILPGRVGRVVAHGGDAEVIATTGATEWIASVVGSAVEALGLAEGVEVSLIVKARSCHVVSAGGSGAEPPPTTLL